MAPHSKTFYWSKFYQIAQSLGLFRVAACRAQAWSQLAHKKAGCLEAAQALLPNHLLNAPRKPFTGRDPEKLKPSISMISLFPFLLVNSDPVDSGFFVSIQGKSREVTVRVVVHVKPPRMMGGEVHVLITTPEEVDRELRGELDKLQPHDDSTQIERVLKEGDAGTEILRMAKEISSDVIVMGTHGRTGLSRLLMGSVAEAVSRKAHCPVLTVKHPFPETSSGEPAA